MLRLRYDLLGCLISLTSVCLAQQAARVIPYQGFITDQSGQAESAKSLNLIFRLYDTPVQGKVQWEEVQSNVSILAGRFNVLLGSRSPLPGLDLFNKVIYLGVTVDDGVPATVDIEMRPRQALVPIVSSFQSLNSLKLNGRDWSDLLVGGVNDPERRQNSCRQGRLH